MLGNRWRILLQRTFKQLDACSANEREKQGSSKMTLRSEAMRGDLYLQNASNNKPPLRLGVRNSGVQIMQQSLLELGYSMPLTTKNGTTDPDGIFGQETLRSVQKFQRDQGLAADGIAGRDTLHRLDQLITKNQEERKPGPLSPTLVGLDQAQWRLCAMWT